MARSYNRERPIGSDGLTVTERRILELWDAGSSREAIMAATGLSVGIVGTALSNFVTFDEERIERAALRHANAAYVAAVAATGRSFA
jgi:hypothetical protein